MEEVDDDLVGAVLLEVDGRDPVGMEGVGEAGEEEGPVRQAVALDELPRPRVEERDGAALLVHGGVPPRHDERGDARARSVRADDGRGFGPADVGAPPEDLPGVVDGLEAVLAVGLETGNGPGPEGEPVSREPRAEEARSYDRDRRGDRPRSSPAPAVPRRPLRLEVGEDVGRGRVAPRGVPLERLRDDGREPGRHAGARRADVRRLLAQARDDAAEGAAGLERDGAREHLVEDDADGVEVGPRVDGAAERLLGGEVLHRPDEPLGLRGARVAPFPVPGEAEVAELHRAVAAEEDVRGLHVAVNDAEAVEVGEGAEDLAGEPDGFLRLERRAGEALPESLPLDELHRQEDGLARLADVVDADEARAVGVAGDGDLAAEALQRALRHPVVAEDLQSDEALQVAVPRRVDRGRAAGAEDGADLVAPADLAPGREEADRRGLRLRHRVRFRLLAHPVADSRRPGERGRTAIDTGCGRSPWSRPRVGASGPGLP